MYKFYFKDYMLTFTFFIVHPYFVLAKLLNILLKILMDIMKINHLKLKKKFFSFRCAIFRAPTFVIVGNFGKLHGTILLYRFKNVKLLPFKYLLIFF